MPPRPISTQSSELAGLAVVALVWLTTRHPILALAAGILATVLVERHLGRRAPAPPAAGPTLADPGPTTPDDARIAPSLLRADEMRLLVKMGSHPEQTTCVIRGVTLTDVEFDDPTRSYTLTGDGGDGTWRGTDGAVSEVTVVTDFSYDGRMKAATPDALWASFKAQVGGWQQAGTELAFISTVDAAFLHDGRTPVPLSTPDHR